MTKKKYKRPALRHHPRHIFRRVFSSWPWIIWGAAGITVVVLLPGGINRDRFHGEAERTYEYVASLEDGRVTELSVAIGDPVKAGQVIGKIDNALLASELLMDRASLMKTRDKINSIRVGLQTLRLEEAQAKADLKTLEAQQARNKDLIAKNLLLEQDTEDLQPQIEAASSVVAQYPILIKTVEKRLQDAEQDTALLDDAMLARVQEEQKKLIARSDGVIAEVLHQAGDVVETGDPIVRISNIETSRVIAFLPEGKKLTVIEGQTCRVISSLSRKPYDAKVLSITADIRKLPVFTGMNAQVLRGRRLVIDLENGATLIPGERVVVVSAKSIFEQWFGRSL